MNLARQAPYKKGVGGRHLNDLRPKRNLGSFRKEDWLGTQLRNDSRGNNYPSEEAGN